MGFELPPYWEQIREESADDLKEYNENFADYLLDKRINLLSIRKFTSWFNRWNKFLKETCSIKI